MRLNWSQSQFLYRKLSLLFLVIVRSVCQTGPDQARIEM